MTLRIFTYFWSAFSKPYTKFILQLIVLAGMSFVMSCSDTGLSVAENGRNGSQAITFFPYKNKQTRAVGEEAANLLNKKFIVYGTKKSGENAPELVFHNYQLNYISNSANTSESNTSGWEYVGYENKYLTTTQSIKFWDYSSPMYQFQAYSLGKGDESTSPATYATASEITNDGYTLEGTRAQLSTCYITNRQTVNLTNESSSEVKMQFMSLPARIRMAFFETIPGYAVKEVKFYKSTTEKSSPAGNGTLYSEADVFINNAKYTISYDENHKVQTACTIYDNQSFIDLGNLNYTTGLGTLKNKTGYMGVLSSAPTYAGDVSSPGYYSFVLPNPTSSPLELKVDYTLESTDWSGETIFVTGATATIPSAFCQWKSNHSYTYLFKISDNTNGATGGDGKPTGLYSITFDTFVEDDGTENNEQGTITSIGDWSITTYQPGSVTETGIRYVSNKMIDVSVMRTFETATDKENIEGTNDWLVVYHQQTPYEWVVEREEPTTTIVDENAAYLVTPITYSDGFGHFIPQSPGTYRVEYWHKEDDGSKVKRAVKIVLVEKGEIEGDFTGENLNFNTFDTE